MASSPICWSATAEHTAPEAEYICPAGFFCGWSVGVELIDGLPERPGSQQRQFLQAPKDVFVWSVLIYTVNHKKRDIIFLTITLANLNRFLQFLYHFNPDEIQHATVLKFTTSP